MTTYVSRELNIFYIMFRIIPFFIITFIRLYVRIVILLSRRKHLHGALFPERFGCIKYIQNKTEITRRQYKNMGKYCQT